MSEYIYSDGPQTVVVVTGQPEAPVQIGTGLSLKEARLFLQPTPIQSAGPAGAAAASALRWAARQGWVSSPDLSAV